VSIVPIGDTVSLSVRTGSLAGTFVGQVLNVAAFRLYGHICNKFPVSQEARGVAQLVGALRKVAGSVPDGTIDLILPTALWLWSRLNL
jgi:hypothetical protein